MSDEYEPIQVTLSREQADDLLGHVVQRIAERAEQAFHEEYFDRDDENKGEALREIIKLAALAGDLL